MRRRHVLLLGQLFAAALIVGIAATGVAPSSHAARDVSPGTFSRVSSGVALIRTYGCGGKSLGQGTGFLVGSSVVMTARHVIVGACRARIRVGGETFFAKRAVSWHGGGASTSAADVATLKLDHASDGFVFRVRSTRVPLGTNLGMVGYPLGNRLSLNQGRRSGAGKENGAPLLAVRMLGAPKVPADLPSSTIKDGSLASSRSGSAQKTSLGSERPACLWGSTSCAGGDRGHAWISAAGVRTAASQDVQAHVRCRRRPRPQSRSK